LVYGREGDPAGLLALAAEASAARLYVRQADLPEGQRRIPLKAVHFNRCPALVAWSHLRPGDLERLGIDAAAVAARAARLRAAGPALAEKVRQVFAATEDARPAADPDAALYDGFLGEPDRRRCAAVRATPPAALAGRDFGFDDPRLDALLFRYRARNWPGLLAPAEQADWDAFRRERLTAGDTARSEYSFASHAAEVAVLREAHAGDARVQGLLDALDAWSDELAAGLAVPAGA